MPPAATAVTRTERITDAERLRHEGFVAAVPVPGTLVPLWRLDGTPAGAMYYPDLPRAGARGARRIEVSRAVAQGLDCGGPGGLERLRAHTPLWLCDDARVADRLAGAGEAAVTLVGPFTAQGLPRYDAAPALADWELVPLDRRQIIVCWAAASPQQLDKIAAALRFRRARPYSLPEIPDEAAIAHIEELRARAHPIEASDGGEKVGALAQLLDLLQLCMVARTPSHDAYLLCPIDHERWECLPLSERGSPAKHWLVHAYQLLADNPHHLPPPQHALTRALESAMAQAQFLPPTTRIWSRYGASESGDTIYIDSCGEQPLLALTAGECTTVPPGTQPPVLFRRSRGQLPLPPPVTGGDIRDLRPFLNIIADTDDEMLLWGWLVGCLLPNGPYPILCLHGPQGSTKSTATKLLRSLIDPHEVPIRSAPKDIEALLLAAQNGALVCLENLSTLPLWLSDALCMLATGGGLSRRELYGEEERLFLAKRPIILNGITELSSRGDLRERCIFINLQRIDDTKRQTEREFWTGWEAIRPRILGALYDAAAFALATVDSVKLPRLPRMADFAQWAYAAMAAFGVAPGEWLDAYGRNRQASTAIEIEQNTLAGLLLEYLEDHVVREESADQLLRHLQQWIAYEQRALPDKFPGNADALGKQLRRLEMLLYEMGWMLVTGRVKTGRWYTIQRRDGDGGEKNGDTWGDTFSDEVTPF
jgi:hypothetical protein